MKYKRVEQEVSAIQYTGGNEYEVMEFLGNTNIMLGAYESKSSFYYEDVGDCLEAVPLSDWYITIVTADGERYEPSKGDWIVVDAFGNLDLFSQERFEKLYKKEQTIEEKEREWLAMVEKARKMKPCPFCGGEAELLTSESGGYSIFHACNPIYGNDEDGVRMKVESRLFGTKVGAIAYWNRRVE